MKKLLKRTLIILGIILFVFALIFVIVFLKMRSATSGFATLETGKVVDNIFAVRDDFANFFIIKDSAQYVVIDCSFHSETATQQMEKLGISPDEVCAVFLTHTDQDHAGGLSLFEKAKLYMSKEEELMITGKKNKTFFIRNSISRTDYTLLEDRQIVTIGNLKIEGILAPGHTTGMMAYLVNDKYLFTGDILSLQEGKIAPIPSIFNMDTKQAIKSMEIICRLPEVEYIITSHWGFVKDSGKIRSI